MGRRKTTGATCKRCGACERDGAVISKNRLCYDCGPELMVENVHSMLEKSGPGWDRWRAAMLETALRLQGGDVATPR